MASDPIADVQATTSSASLQEAAVNGDHASDAPEAVKVPSENGVLSTDDPLLRKEVATLSTKPIEHVANGIQPAADFLPKDVPIHSHPTPPPDQPLDTSESGADVEMTNGDANVQPSTENATSQAASNDSSLVRPREDDDDDERSAKRNKVDDAPQEEQSPTDIPASVNEPNISENSIAKEQDMGKVKVEIGSELAETVSTSLAPARTELEPPLTSNASARSDPPPTAALATSQTPAVTTTSTAAEIPAVTPSIESTTANFTPAVLTNNVPAVKYSTAPMTPLQKTFIADKMKNLKKTKHSIAFLRPVDYMALNIPAYPELIKQPMDLGTMESKLKGDQYASVQDFVDDFNLIIANVRRFNGDAHPVTQAGLSMEAYFRKMMETVPSPDQALPAKVTKKRSPSIGNKPLPRREPRAVAPPPTPPAPKTETFALQPDGTPQIRRDSTGRPARAIKPPQSRDLTYAKPKRKEALLELKFCEFVLEELRGPKYDKVNSVFLYPVDPVALNIPHYRQVVKNPMDISTMAQKLRQGQYAKASEFKKDFELMIQNCLSFNPHGNPVRDMGVQFQRDFASLWSQKDRWEKANKPEVRANSHSADEDSGDEDEDDEENHDDDKEATIQSLQKQLLDMQNTIMSMAAGKSVKPKKAKTKSTKKAGATASQSKVAKSNHVKAKPKKPRQVTYEEKQEISEAVGRMTDSQVTKLTQIITENCAKYRDMDEMELEIDDLPNDVQAMLLKYVRSLFGNPNRTRAVSPDDGAAVDDDDFEPSTRGGAGGGKRKKHKPMGKREQGEAIKNLESKLAQFNGPGEAGSESPINARQQADSSSDEESEESEEE